MASKSDDISNEILALVGDDLSKSDSSTGGRPRRHINNDQDSDSNLSASSESSVDSVAEGRRRQNLKVSQESSSDDDLNLMHLTEIEREQIIAEKAEKNQTKYERQELLSRLNKQKKSAPKRAHSYTQDSDEGSDKEFIPSSRPSRPKSSKVQALKELNERRNKKKKQVPQVASDHSSQEEAYYPPLGPKTPSEELDSSPPISQLSDIRTILLTRKDLVMLLHDRMLEKIVVGCFVSVALEPKPDGTPVYRLGRISRKGIYLSLIAPGVKETDEHYDVEENKRTHRMLELAHGGDLLDFPFNVVSNRPSSEVELRRFLESCHQDKVPPITQNYVKKKTDEIKALRERPIIEEDFIYSLRSKRISTNDLTVLINFRNFFTSKLRNAQENDDPSKLAELKEDLAKVEQDMAPHLEEHRKKLVAEEARKAKEAQEAAERRKRLLLAATEVKEVKVARPAHRVVYDSDVEGAKDKCFTLKPPKGPVKTDFAFPSSNPLAPKLNLESISMTPWEAAADEALSSL
ncbi:RNA polymerase-associated protein rtf1 [Entomophthora muscae]|uniref:RNA polymerase-associated protein rtf1 n=1 Tax=Entomophthora muscae TaxID=34485 RepID=A0ACC2TQ64_9FUNG|nr:RNA polymerase-associated protein rtf1 [Entomophthora muscae]